MATTTWSSCIGHLIMSTCHNMFIRVITCPSTFDVEWSFLQSCLSQSSNFTSVFTCTFTYTITTMYITLNQTHMRRSQPHGYIDFPILSRVTDCSVGLLNAGNSQKRKSEQDTTVEKPVATQQCMPVFMKMRCETMH